MHAYIYTHTLVNIPIRDEYPSSWSRSIYAPLVNRSASGLEDEVVRKTYKSRAPREISVMQMVCREGRGATEIRGARYLCLVRRGSVENYRPAYNNSCR